MNSVKHLFTHIPEPKIYIHTPTAAISEGVQKALFKLGYHWSGNLCILKYLNNQYVVVYRDFTNLSTNNVYDSDAYFTEANILLHGNTLKKLH